MCTVDEYQHEIGSAMPKKKKNYSTNESKVFVNHATISVTNNKSNIPNSLIVLNVNIRV